MLLRWVIQFALEYVFGHYTLLAYWASRWCQTILESCATLSQPVTMNVKIMLKSQIANTFSYNYVLIKHKQPLNPAKLVEW